MRLVLKLIIGAVLLSLAAVGGYVMWNVAQSAKAAKDAARQVERTGKAVEDAAKRAKELADGEKVKKARREWRRIRNAGGEAAKAFRKAWKKNKERE